MAWTLSLILESRLTELKNGANNLSYLLYFHRLLKGFNELLNENYKISYKSKVLQRHESTVFGKLGLSVLWEE